MPVACQDDAFELRIGPVTSSMRLERSSHSGAGLSGTNHQAAPLGLAARRKNTRQAFRNDVLRLCNRKRSRKSVF